MDHKQVEQDARFFATRIAQQIAAEANKRPTSERGAFAGTAASLVLQTIVTTIVVGTCKPGSADGTKAIKATYDAATLDALERWQRPDLKERFGGG